MSRGQILPPDVPIPENHGDHAAAAAQDQNAQADIVPGPGPDAQQSAQARQKVAEAVPFPHDRIFPVVGWNVGDGLRGDLLPGPEIHRAFLPACVHADAEENCPGSQAADSQKDRSKIFAHIIPSPKAFLPHFSGWFR